MDDLVGLGMIAVVYGTASVIKTSGFLAVFFAAVALRQTELVLAGAPKDRQGLMEPDTAKSEVAKASERTKRRSPSAPNRWCSRSIWSACRN
jgi:hypothetical protein